MVNAYCIKVEGLRNLGFRVLEQKMHFILALKGKHITKWAPWSFNSLYFGREFLRVEVQPKIMKF